MATEQAFKSKVTVSALCTFSTGKPLDPPLEFSHSYFRYNSNKLDLFFSYSRAHQKQETERSEIALKVRTSKHQEISMKNLKTK